MSGGKIHRNRKELMAKVIPTFLKKLGKAIALTISMKLQRDVKPWGDS
jgi:hypothetical protein